MLAEHGDSVGNIEWPIPWQTSGRRQLRTVEGWVPWKCTSFHLWDLLPNTSANWHGVRILFVYLYTFGSFTNILMLRLPFSLFSREGCNTFQLHQSNFGFFLPSLTCIEEKCKRTVLVSFCQKDVHIENMDQGYRYFYRKLQVRK